jgi:hypothetical protein
MALLKGPHDTTWLPGALRLLAAAAIASPVLAYPGARRWALFVGAFVVALLGLGALERLWQARPLPRRVRPVEKRRFRVFAGGKGDKGKGNGHAHDVPGDGDAAAGPGDKPRWLM